MNKTFHITTIGCQMNKSDSERISAYLRNRGWKPVDARSKAGLAVLTTCGVRQTAEDRIYGLVPKIKKENPKAKILLTGCLSSRKDVIRRLAGSVDFWMNIHDLPGLDRLLVPSLKPSGTGNRQSPALIEPCDYLKIKPDYASPFSAFIPIGNGCDNYCTYCVVPFARGREAYRPAREIIDEAESLARNGYKEITFIAQNVNSYRNPDRSSPIKDFADLIQAVDRIGGDFWIRFYTSHPKDMSVKLIRIIADSKKVCEHLHLPAQSGDDEILSRMNRKYTASSYLGLISRVKEAYSAKQKTAPYPIPSLSTDIIVGFPGETAAMFRHSASLIKTVAFDMVYTARYSPRPGTAAAKLSDDVSPETKKKREEQLVKILEKSSLKNNRKYLGSVIRVLVEAKNAKGVFVGKTRTSKTVKFKASRSKHDLVGSFRNVLITGAENFGLTGELSRPAIIAILGPTASGKTTMAVKLAARINGEIVSADSRQVYRGMDIGTGKDLKEYSITKRGKTIAIPYHLIDVADPDSQFTLADYLEKAKQAINSIISRERVPIICGGTGLYAQALLEGYSLPPGSADNRLRQEWDACTAEELRIKLSAIDPTAEEELNDSDRSNKRRLIRAIEKSQAGQQTGKASGLESIDFDIRLFAIDKPFEILEERIRNRLKVRLEKEGMIEEVKRLIEIGLPPERLDSFGLEYRFISRYLSGGITYQEMENLLYIAIRRFAKRQLTWLRRWARQGRKIDWVKNVDDIYKNLIQDAAQFNKASLARNIKPVVSQK